MDRKRDTRGRAAFAVQSVQRKFYCRQPVVVRHRTARLGGSIVWGMCMRAIRRLRLLCSALDWRLRRACFWAMPCSCPISEVGSVASAIGWLAACAAYYRMGPPLGKRFVAVVGVTVGLLMILMKIAPGIPGHFSVYEWLALAIWSLIGISLSRRQESMAVTSEE